MTSEASRLLVSAIRPDWAGPAQDLVRSGSDEVLRDAIRIARVNGLYFPLGRRLREAGRALPSEQDSMWRAELEQHDALLRTIRFLNEASEDSGIEYLVIKDCPTIDHVPRDVDVLVRGVDREAFLRLLQSRGLALEYASEAEVSLRGPGMLRIDVYSEIRYLGREFVRQQFLWSRKRTRSTEGMEHPGLASEATYLLNLIHGFLGRGSISLLDILDLSALEMEDSGAARREAAACGWVRVFDRLAKDLAEKRSMLLQDGQPLPFPYRYRRSFVMELVGEIDGLSLGPRERIGLRASLLLDDVVFHLENSGIANGLRRSRVVPRIGNTLGHRLRMIRGDSKGQPGSRRG